MKLEDTTIKKITTEIRKATIKNTINLRTAFFVYSLGVVYEMFEKKFLPSQMNSSNCMNRRTNITTVPSSLKDSLVRVFQIITTTILARIIFM
jgi:heptaprenylglyceryl phosphate synthase